MTDMDAIYVAEPRLESIEELVRAVVRRDGVIPWEHVQCLLATFLGQRRDASVIAPRTGAVEEVLPALRGQATLVEAGHRLRRVAASMDGDRQSDTRRQA